MCVCVVPVAVNECVLTGDERKSGNKESKERKYKKKIQEKLNKERGKALSGIISAVNGR